MSKKLNIAFVWHMHQPLYKEPFSGEYHMPWVLYHATKDYYDMAAILEEFPDIHQTFNLVPSLIKQINDYCDPHTVDRFRALSLKPASELDATDKAFILKNFFQANVDNMIRPYPRFRELFVKRGDTLQEGDVQSTIRYFVEQDYLDLQVLFNLAWIDPTFLAEEPLRSLVKKERNFTEQDKSVLMKRQSEIVKLILPKYAELIKKGIIEVSTTPYYHPIMPLLCDSKSALEAMPWAKLPEERFMHPEDAQAQLDNAVKLYRETFGTLPHGIWPSEGSVSMDVLPLLKSIGVRWFATDEDILANSIKRGINRDSYGNCRDSFLYKPYSIEVGDGSLSVVFRDRVLSDLIGFDYARMDPNDASSDMIGRLERIHAMLENPQDHIVSIILDGENAWETFRNDGRDFLVSLYAKLSESSTLKCVTVNEFLSKNSQREALAWLYPGSWISHNFKIWIGHSEDNAAWDFISAARKTLVNHEEKLRLNNAYDDNKDTLALAWEEIYAAEGSDWFWWYGDEHSSLSDEFFDHLFRQHIKRVYSLIGMEPPVELEIPIISEVKGFKPTLIPATLINPEIDGQISNYFEWLGAGKIVFTHGGVSMHREVRSGGIVGAISYGFSSDKMFLRFDYVMDQPYQSAWNVVINFIKPSSRRLAVSIKGKESSAEIFELSEDDGTWLENKDASIECASDTVVEIAIPFKAAGVTPGHDLGLFIVISSVEHGDERWPAKGFLSLETPGPDFEMLNWSV